MGKVIGQAQKRLKNVLGMQVLCRTCKHFAIDETVKRRQQKLCHLSAHWSNSHSNAVEFSILSNNSVCYSGINGR
jgi:hypothetical protein